VSLASLPQTDAVDLVLQSICFFEDSVRDLQDLDADMSGANTLLVMGSSLMVSTARFQALSFVCMMI
jgi:hypothetical protein